MGTPISLRVIRDGVVVSTHRVEEDVIKIGRLATAHIHLDDPKVSRIHAVIEVAADGAVSVIDMGSAQGTLVHGKRVTKEPLSSGDRIIVGDTAIEVSMEEVGAGAEVAAPAPEVVSSEAVSSEAVSSEAVSSEAVSSEAVSSEAVSSEAVSSEAVSSEAVSSEAVSSEAVSSEAVSSEAASSEAASSEAVSSEAAAIPQRMGETAANEAKGRSPTHERTEVRQHQALTPWPTEGRGMDLVLNVRLSWGDQPLDAASFSGDEPVTLGGEGATFSVDPGTLMKVPFPLARREGERWYLGFTEGMDGGILHGEDSKPLASLLQAGVASQGSEGVFEVPLQEDEAAWVDLGNVRAEFFFRPKRKPISSKWSESLDYGYLNILLLAVFLVAASIVSFENMDTSYRMTADDLFANQARFTKLLIRAPEKEQRNPFLQRLKELKKPDEATVRAPGEEGKAGKKDAPVVARRSAPQAIDPNDEEVIKNQGILSMLGKGSAGLSTVLGSGGLGGELKGAIGGITGTTTGDAQGFGGLGLRGTGVGGGAVGETVSVGAIGTRGRGGGSEGFGAGVGGLGKKGSAEVRIDTSAVSITGTIDRELIRRVIQQNHGKFKYCYESELVKQPQLSGRVAIQFQINTAGKVILARVDSTTLGNAAVENCVASRIRQLTFPMPQGGGSALVTYPFVFNPPGE